MATSERPHYHHGSLRQALLQRVAEVVADSGAHAVTFRGLASDLGVSHTAPAHHFGNRTGLLTAFATEGFELLSAELETAPREDFVALGVAYVRFALSHPGHFSVMFDNSQLDLGDPHYHQAAGAAMAMLRAGVEQFDDSQGRSDAAALTMAAWGMMHGIATLALAGALDASGVRAMVEGGDVLAIAGRAARLLRRPGDA